MVSIFIQKNDEKDNIVDVILDNGNTILKFSIAKKIRNKTTHRYSFSIIRNDSLAFDHPLVILSGMERLKNSR